jgi:hypothetical protein
MLQLRSDAAKDTQMNYYDAHSCAQDMFAPWENYSCRCTVHTHTQNKNVSQFPWSDCWLAQDAGGDAETKDPTYRCRIAKNTDLQQQPSHSKNLYKRTHA